MPTTSRADALAARYGAALPPAGPWNAQIDLLLSHRSIRAYRPDAPPEGTLETLIAAAQSAATSSNLQSWSVVAVNDPATRAALARIANNQKHIQQCPIFLVWLADPSRNARLAEAEGVELAAVPYFETFLVAAIDAALAAQNAVVAAESLGLSTVYIGALRNDPAQVAALLGLPPGVAAVFGLCIGTAAEGDTSEVKPRLPQAAVLFHDTYGTAEEGALRTAYDRAMMALSTRQGMGAQDWSKRVIDRMGRIAAMSGRDRLVAVLRGMGIALR